MANEVMERAVFELHETAKKRTVPVDQTRIDYLNEKKMLATALGLAGQVGLLDKEITDLRKPHVTVEPMTADEVRIWRKFLPTEYTDRAYAAGERYIKYYSFDRIPHAVMAKWAECKSDNIYENYEIWTPEIPRAVDPVLVGVIGKNRYMIARWAESDANLITFAGVKRILVRRWLADRGFGAGLFLAFISTFITFIATMLFTHDPVTSTFFTVLGHNLLSFAWPLAAVLWAVYTVLHAAGSDLMCAIWRTRK